ncbi:MAG: Plug domain-containing protein [Steroidobacteraceae bacterium]
MDANDKHQVMYLLAPGGYPTMAGNQHRARCQWVYLHPGGALMSSKTNVAARMLVASAVAAALSGNAMAQAQLEEITVTARKTTENLQDVPLTITAFSADTIERANIKNVQDVVKFTPGLNYDKGFAPQDTRISIRGLPVVRGKPPVGVLLDGIDISSESISTAGGSSLVNVKLVELQQIEVVKGPQSALYGRSAFGGAVVYTSKRPNLDQMEGNLSLEVASDSAYEAKAASQHPAVGRQGRDARQRRLQRFRRLLQEHQHRQHDRRRQVRRRLGGAALQAGRRGGLHVAPLLQRRQDRVAPLVLLRHGQRPCCHARAAGQRRRAASGPQRHTPLPATWNFPTIGKVSTSGKSSNLSVDPLTGKDFDAGRLKPFVASLVGDIDLGWASCRAGRATPAPPASVARTRTSSPRVHRRGHRALGWHGRDRSGDLHHRHQGQGEAAEP